MPEYWLGDKQFNCACCIYWFNEGKDKCKKCGFDMNQWNEVHTVGLEPTNPLGLALEASGFDRFPTYALHTAGFEPANRNGTRS